MKQFNVILYDVNTNELEKYDVIPYIIGRYKERLEYKLKNKKCEAIYYTCPETREEFYEFIKMVCLSQYWSRCQYELLVTGFPIDKKTHKIDAYYQIMNNIELVVDIVMEEVEKIKK